MMLDATHLRALHQSGFPLEMLTAGRDLGVDSAGTVHSEPACGPFRRVPFTPHTGNIGAAQIHVCATCLGADPAFAAVQLAAQVLPAVTDLLDLARTQLTAAATTAEVHRASQNLGHARVRMQRFTPDAHEAAGRGTGDHLGPVLDAVANLRLQCDQLCAVLAQRWTQAAPERGPARLVLFAKSANLLWDRGNVNDSTWQGARCALLTARVLSPAGRLWTVGVLPDMRADLWWLAAERRGLVQDLGPAAHGDDHDVWAAFDAVFTPQFGPGALEALDVALTITR